MRLLRNYTGRFAPSYKYTMKCIQQRQEQLQQQLQQQPQQLKGHLGNFFQHVQTHLAQTHLAFSEILVLHLHLQIDIKNN